MVSCGFRVSDPRAGTVLRRPLGSAVHQSFITGTGQNWGIAISITPEPGKEPPQSRREHVVLLSRAASCGNAERDSRRHRRPALWEKHLRPPPLETIGQPP